MKNKIVVHKSLFVFAIAMLIFNVVNAQSTTNQPSNNDESNVIVSNEAYNQYDFLAKQGTVYHFSCCNNEGTNRNDNKLSVVLPSTKEVLAFNDDECGKNASITWCCPQTGTYQLICENVIDEKNQTVSTTIHHWAENPKQCEKVLSKSIKIASLPFANGPGNTYHQKNTINNNSIGTNVFSNNYNGDDLIFEFQPITEGTVKIKLQNNTSDVMMALFEGCPLAGNESKMIAMNEGDQTLLLTASVNNSSNYYLVVDSKMPTQGFFFKNLEISAPFQQAPSASKLTPSTNDIVNLELESFNNQVLCKFHPKADPKITEYQLERGTDGLNFDIIERIAANAFEDIVYADKEVNPNQKYYYRIRTKYQEGTSSFTSINAVHVSNENTAVLELKYNSEAQITTVNYVLSKSSYVNIVIEDPQGNPVKQYQQGLQAKGQYTFPFKHEGNIDEMKKYTFKVWVDDDVYVATSASDY